MPLYNPPSAGGVADHGALTGLADDDHDYVLPSELTTHAALTQGHPPVVVNAIGNTSHTAVLADEVILASPATARIVTLPAPGGVDAPNGKRFTIVKIDATHSVLTITPASGLINGRAFAFLINPNGFLTVVSDGTNYHVIGRGSQEVVNAADYGAIGDNTTDATVALQAAITASISLGLPLYVPAGRYVVSASLIVHNTRGFMFGGAGVRGGSTGPVGTYFVWAGNATTPLLRITDTRDSYFENFFIACTAATPLKAGIQQYKTVGATLGPRLNRFFNIAIDGTNGGLGKGFLFGGAVGAGGVDEDNDNCELRGCVVSNYSVCAGDFADSQAKGYRLYNCDAYGGTLGRVGWAAGYDYIGAVDTWTTGGSFGIWGGFLTAHDVADFGFGGLNDPIHIENVHSENSARFYYENGAGSKPVPLTITSCRFEHAGDLHADALFIRRATVGPTFISNCEFTDFVASAARISLNASSGRHQLTLKQCMFGTTHNTLAGFIVANQPIDLDASGVILVHSTGPVTTFVPATIPRRQISTKTGAYTLTDFDQGSPVYANAAGGAFTITLPTAVGREGTEFLVVRVNTGANAVTIATTSSQQIDFAAPRSLTSQYDTLHVVSDGTNWTTRGARYFTARDSGSALHGVGIGDSGTAGRALNVFTGNLDQTALNPSTGVYVTATLIPNSGQSSASSLRGVQAVVRGDAVSGQTLTGVIAGVWSDTSTGSGSAGTVSDVRGFYAAVNHGGAGTATAVYALFARFGPGAAGNITNCYGVYVNPYKGAAGVPVSVYGIFITAMSALGNTNGYGLYIQDVSNGATLNYAIYTNAGTVRIGGMLTVVGNLDHDGSNIGFFGVAPAVRASAYTQTYATASKTIANPTATALTDNSAGTANTTLEALADGTTYATDVAAIRNNFADLAAAVNALIVDVAGNKQNLTSVIDDLQLYGLLQ